MRNLVIGTVIFLELLGFYNIKSNQTAHDTKHYHVTMYYYYYKGIITVDSNGTYRCYKKGYFYEEYK